MSVYNGERFLKKAIMSILAQTYKDFEFIIINDGSTDNSQQISDEFKGKDQRIRLITRGNKGLIRSLNEGISLANGEYIARMDADDVSKVNRFEEQLEYMLENNLAISGTWAEGIDTAGNRLNDMDYPPDVKKIRYFTLLHNPFIHSSVMFKKDIFDKVGGYNKYFKHIEDYELWTRIVFKYPAGNIRQRLLEYRFHEGQITQKNHISMMVMGVLVRMLALYRFVFRF